MKYISIDIESTGLDPEICDIIEFGAILDDLSNQIPLDELPTYHTYFSKKTFTGEPFALSMHKEIFQRISERKEGYTYLSAEKLGYQFKQFLLKNGYNLEKDRITINVAGKNFNALDSQILKNKTDFFKHVQPASRLIDPAILYYKDGDERLPSLSECLERAGFDKIVKHDALSDAMDVVRLVRAKLINAHPCPEGRGLLREER